MQTNRLKTKEKPENHEFKIRRSGYFFVGERTDAAKEGFQCASWATVRVNFIIIVFF